jgi:hypothetical protein
MEKFQNGVYPSVGYAGSDDTDIDSYYTTDNYSGDSVYWVGYYSPNLQKERCLIKFDMTSLVPTTAVVTGAYLTINVSSCRGSNIYTAYALSSPFDVSTATWLLRNSIHSWNDVAGGGDYNPTIYSDNITIDSAGTFVFTLNTSTVQDWVTYPSDNFGVIIKAYNESTGDNEFEMASGINSSAALRPVLKVYYTLQ